MMPVRISMRKIDRTEKLLFDEKWDLIRLILIYIISKSKLVRCRYHTKPHLGTTRRL
jgi:hypothetical protein